MKPPARPSHSPVTPIPSTFYAKLGIFGDTNS
jgi:hypothetical protein